MKAKIRPPKLESLGSTKYTRVLQILESAKKGLPEDIKDFDIPIEYLIGGCYPDLWEKFKENINEYFNAGYQQGLKDATESKNGTTVNN